MSAPAMIRIHWPQSFPWESLSLGKVLKRIRDRREHGFKTVQGARDVEILRHTHSIVAEICEKAIVWFQMSDGEADRSLKN